ncbi:MAG: phosphatase PAP2 family protein [Candidatus Hydrogenedens sp.]|nr:phosphatase PAP2 family protein [Candidatus Hydrogenedens sp.]
MVQDLSKISDGAVVKPAVWFLMTGAAAAAVIVCILWLDAPAALYVETWHDTPVRGVAKKLSELGNSAYYLIPAGLAALTLLRRPSAWARKAQFLFWAVAATGIASALLKIIIGRPRPGVFIETGDWTPRFFQLASEYGSFPSGHTTTVFTAATVGILLWPRWAALFLSMAVLGGLARIGAGAHFPSDVVAGAGLGVLGTLLLWPRFRGRLHQEPPHAG